MLVVKNIFIQIINYIPDGLIFNVFENKYLFKTQSNFIKISFQEKIEICFPYFIEYLNLILIILILYLLFLNLVEHTIRFFFINYIMSLNIKNIKFFNIKLIPNKFLYKFFKTKPNFIVIQLAD
jgi:hypothetical protein